LLHEPEQDDGYYHEVTWLLDLFVHGLRSEKVCRLRSLST
jgi:nucleolar pre-ribosomal-associated protein 1